MACVDELRAASVEGDAQELAGCRGLATVVEEGLAGLLGQGFSGAAGATGGIDQQSGHQGRVDDVTHGVGDRQVQGVGVEAVVVGVPSDGGDGDQCAGEGELRGFAGGGGRQELGLDLRCQADRGGAVAPVVEVREPVVGDEDVRQSVRGFLHLRQHLRSGLGEEELQDFDGVAVRHRREDPLPRPAPIAVSLIPLFTTRLAALPARAGFGQEARMGSGFRELRSGRREAPGLLRRPDRSGARTPPPGGASRTA